MFSILPAILLSAVSIAAQDVSVCGSQIYTPGTGTCYTTPAGGQQLCLYQTNTAGQQVITFLCGTVCYDAGKYVCRGNVLTDQTGVPSLALARSTGVAATTQQGTATTAAPVASGSLLASQSRVASSAASQARSSSRASSSPAATSGAARSGAELQSQLSKGAVGAVLGLVGMFAFGAAF